MVNRYLRKFYYKPISLQLLADLINCNPVYLSNTYTKVLKVSPIRHLQNIRMSKSEQLLLTTNLKIGQIAEAVGYISLSQFSSVFKQYFGVTPFEYRKEQIIKRGIFYE
ncbi:helix-turn-helix domain-containing protein [Paenibacillus assamensis]|uniref:helix-turn-helix transcriptional regulator n=1 Tax=Paenibacillus assamensis TaxID=311244 RepID=UPI0003FA5B4F